MSTENTIAPDTSEVWFNERQARVASEKARNEAQEIAIRNAFAGIESRWQQLGEQAQTAYSNEEMLAIVEERQRLKEDATALQNGFEKLQQEKPGIEFAERVNKLDYQDLRNIVPEKSRLFLDVFRSKLESNPAVLKKLLQADEVARSQFEPLTNNYYAAIERQMGWGPEERKFTFDNELGESDEQRASRNATKREQQKEVQLTPEMIQVAKDLNITSDEYAKHMKNPFSEASQPVQVTLDDSKEAPIEVRFEQEKPTRRTVDPAKYKPSQSSMTLSPAQVKFCTEAGLDPKEYVKHALDVQSGKSNHQWYEQRLKSQGLA